MSKMPTLLQEWCHLSGNLSNRYVVEKIESVFLCVDYDYYKINAQLNKGTMLW